MLPRNAGSPWTLEEEKRLYAETGNGLSVADIAADHGRTDGAITSRQRLMGLRDESGELSSPMPDFQSGLRREDKREAAPSAGRKRRRKRGSSSVLRAVGGAWREPQAAAQPAEPLVWPEDFPGNGNWIEKLWHALRHDAQALLRDGPRPETNAERAIDIALTRLTPADDFHTAATLEELGARYGVVRERIRQIQIKVVRRLAGYVRQKKSLTAHVLKEMADDMPEDQEQAPLSWFATELARHGCRTAFTEFVLMAFVGLRAPSPKEARRLVAQAIPPFRRMRRAESSERRRHDVGGELSEQARKANAFVLDILKKAVWPERLNGRRLDLSGFPPLRDCRYERPYYSRTLKRLVQFDSMGERQLIRALDVCTVVTEFTEQPVKIGYQLDDRNRTYVPDLLVRTDTDLFFVIEIKARPQLADRETLAKAEAAQHHLGARGIGYCLTDKDGFGLDDLRALEPDDEFRRRLEELMRRNRTVRRETFEQTFGRENLQWAYDQLQSVVLREGLRYDTSMIDHPRMAKRTIFNFRLRAR